MRKVIGTSESLLDIVFRNDKPETATAGGSVLNAMVSTARAGIGTTLVSYVGDDYVGKEIIRFLQENGVSIEHITRCQGMKSPISIAHLDANGEATYSFYHDTAFHHIDMTYPEIRKDDILLIGSFFSVDEKMRPVVSALLDYARLKKAIIVYDLNFRPAHKRALPRVKVNILENMGYADIIKGSREDIEIVFGTSDPREVYDEWLKRTGKPLICTDGAKAVTLVYDENAEIQYDVPQVDVKSTIGAGDNFNAGLIYGLVKDRIDHKQLQKKLRITMWNRLINCATEFAAACCKETFNYVPSDFGKRKARGIKYRDTSFQSHLF